MSTHELVHQSIKIGKKLETVQIFTSSWMVKQTMVYSYNGILLSSKKNKKQKEQTLGILNNMDKKWQKADQQLPENGRDQAGTKGEGATAAGTRKLLAVLSVLMSRDGVTGGVGQVKLPHAKWERESFCHKSPVVTLCYKSPVVMSCYVINHLLWSGLSAQNTCFCCLSFLLDHVRNSLNL